MGTSVILETSGTPIEDEKGNFLGYRGADTDITERKRREDQIKFRNVLVCLHSTRASPDGMLVVDEIGIKYYRQHSDCFYVGIPSHVIETKSG